MSNFVAGSGNPHAKLMFVGEAPGKTEDETGIPFSGASGELLWSICNELGILRNEVWTTNVYKYRPPNNNLKKISEVCNIDQQVHNLWNEIKEVNPNCIVALGSIALQTLTGKSGLLKWRGSILTTRDGTKKVIGALHPSNVIRSESFDYRKPYPYIWKQIIKADIARGLEESKTPNLELPETYIHICRDSMQLRRFFDNHRHLDVATCDIESIYCIPVCISITFNGIESIVVPFFNRISDINIGGVPLSDQAFIWQQLDEFFKAKLIVGQNFKYDQEKLQMIGFSFKRPRPIHSDTLLKAHTINPELPSKKMEMLQSIWTRRPYHKDEGKIFNHKKDKIDKLFHYCGLDSLSTHQTNEEMDVDLKEMSDEFHVDMMKFYYEYVMELHEIYMDMERIGFRLDENARAALKMKYNTWHDNIHERLNANLPDFHIKGTKCHKEHKVNTAAHAQVKSLIYGYLNLPTRKKGGKITSDEDAIVSLLNNVVKDERKRSILFDISEDRRVRKTLGTYILSKPDYDGRIRGAYRITGTETGRSSTSILSPPLRPIKSGHAFQTLTKHGSIGSDIRSMYIPDEGFVFVGVDLSQAEPRIVAVLSEDWELLKAFNSGKVDIHRRTAALVLDLYPDLDLGEKYNEVADSLGKDSGERFLGKKSRNGGNYDMGKGELAENIASDAKRFGINISVSEWRAGKMLENFHRASPKIREVFHRSIQEAINDSRVLINPYGRVRRFFERLEKKTYGEGYAHIPQSTVADHVKNSIIILKKGDMKDLPKMLMGEAHDALLFRFPINEYKDRAALVRKVFERPISFHNCTLKRDIDLVIPADCEVSETSYKNMEKLKF